MITSDSSEIEIKNARRFGEILQRIRLTPVIKNHSKKDVTGDNPVFFKIEAQMK
jgi:hypothetical protein